MLPGVLSANDDRAFFESRIRPLLAEHCYECHSARASKVKGGLLLDSREGVQKGGDSGVVIVAGAPSSNAIPYTPGSWGAGVRGEIPWNVA